MPTLAINPQAIARLRSTIKPPTNAAFAQRIGVEPSTISRLLNGKASPGPQFIAGVLDQFGIRGLGEVLKVIRD